jgi:HD-GYP domain-containing protein (c-di-GMP phosphodiesterase class II)
MFDILRNKDNNKDKQKDTLPQTGVADKEEKSKECASQPLSFSRAILSAKTDREKKAEDKTENEKIENQFLVSKKLIATVKEHDLDSQAKSKEVYQNAVGVIKFLLEKIRVDEDLNPYMDKIQGLLDDMFNQLVLGNSILANIYERESDEYHLPYHIMNVFLLSSFIALNMGFNKSRLSHLGLACIFYDVGLDAFKGIVFSPKKFDESEHRLIQTHISKSLCVAKKLNLNDTVKESISMHHERVNGKGYPDALCDNTINSYAKIIALADTYEALTNNRPYREAQDGHKALCYILGFLKDYFDPGVVKAFINKMSIYPIGCIVKLSTQELARIVGVQPGSPLRPVAMIIRDAAGKPVQEIKTIDLSREEYSSILLQVYSKPS